MLWKMYLQMKLSSSSFSAVVSFMNYILFHLVKENLEQFAIVHFREQNALMVCMVVDQRMLSEQVKRFLSLPSCWFQGFVQM